MRTVDGLIARLRSARDFQPQQYLPMAAGGQTIGWVRRDHAGRLRAWPGLFEISGEEIRLRQAKEPELSASFAQVARALADDGAIRGWRGETYAIRAGVSPAIVFHLERAATRFFGLNSSAAHLNGFFLQKENPCIWIARRAATKAIDPGMLDTLVAGGVPSGEEPGQALLRECGEEAEIGRAHV